VTANFSITSPRLRCRRVTTNRRPPRRLVFSAVELFAERVAASLDSFELTSDNVATVVDICHRLDGIPLAIELAAARVDLFGVEGLASRLNDCFSILTKGRRTALPRHQTLRATLDWSFELLSDAEKVVLPRLATLIGEFTMEAAIALGSGTGSAPADLVDTITGLIEKIPCCHRSQRQRRSLPLVEHDTCLCARKAPAQRRSRFNRPLSRSLLQKICTAGGG